MLAKFSQHEDLKQRLLHDIPGEAEFVEHCGDMEWGDGGDGSGKNLFGQVLTEVRDSLAEEARRRSQPETRGNMQWHESTPTPGLEKEHRWKPARCRSTHRLPAHSQLLQGIDWFIPIPPLRLGEGGQASG